VNAGRVSSAVGAVLVVVGFAMMFVPGLSALFPPNEVYLTVVGVGFALQTVTIGRSRTTTPYEQTDTGDPEISQDLPTPGDDFDELLAQAGTTRRYGNQRETVRERLRHAAVDVVVRTEGVSREDAVARIESGSWTDDPYAAAFFTGRVEDASLVERLSLFDRTRSQYERWATHAAREIVERSEGAEP